MMSDVTVNSLTSREVCLEQPGAILNAYPVIGLPCHKIENEAAGFSLMPGLESDEIQIIPNLKLAPSFSELKQKLDRMKAEQPNVNGYGTADEEICLENKLPESGSSSTDPLKPDDTIPVEKKADESFANSDTIPVEKKAVETSANSVQVDSCSVVDKVNDCQVSSSLTLRPRRAKTNSQSDHDGSVTSVSGLSSPKSRSRRSKVKGDTNEQETDEKNDVPATLSAVLPKSEQILDVLPPAPSLPLENVGEEVKTTELEKSATSPVPVSSPNLRPRRSKVQESKRESVQIASAALPESVLASVEISLIEISPQVYSVSEANKTELIETHAKSSTSPIPGSSPNLRPRRAKVQESKQESIQVKKEKSENVKSEKSFHTVSDSLVSNLDVNTNTSSDLTSTGFQVEESPRDLLTSTTSDQSDVSNEQFKQNSAVSKLEASAAVEKNALPADIADKSNVEPPLQSFCAETSTGIELKTEVEDSLNVSVMSGLSSPISGSSSFILSPEMKSKGAKTNDKLKMQLKRKKESMKHPLETSESCVQQEIQTSEPLPSKEIQNGIVTESAMASTTADPVKPEDSEVPIKWKIGDMFWARVSGHPWWPCMVAPDPFESLYTRISKHNKFKVNRKRDYHMHYFGNEAERGWVCETSMIPYEGKEAFEKLISERIAQDKKNKALFEVKPSRMWARNIAIESAEVAYTLDQETRIQRFMIIYEEPKPKSKKVKKDSPDEGTKGKRKAGSDAGGDVACMPKKKKKMIASEQVIQIGDITFTELLNPDSLDEQDAMEDEEMSSESGKKINSNSESEHVGKRVRLRAHHKLGKKSGKDCGLNGGSEDGSDETRPPKTSTEDSDPDQDDDNIHYMISPKRPVKQVVVENVFEFQKLTNNSFLKKEDFCMKCEQPGGAFLHCSGPCRGTFHASCLGLTTDVPETFTCVGCTTGCHSCFVCKREDKDLVRCKVVLCGRFYHRDCVKDLKLTSYKKNNLICPMHACATCASESESNPSNPRSTKGRLLKCIRCPKAYHVGDFCVPAGSLNICGLNILCSDHFTPDPKKKCQDRVNVSWCFVCAKGGTLVCCESCPSAFHVECLDDKPPLDGAWHCELCTNGKRPLYGEIIWIKIGIYRWWPGEVCHPRNVPTNIQNMSHSVGEFPVHFFGSNDYNWTNRSRVFSFQEGDKGAKNWCCTNNLQKYFRKGIEVANEAYKLLTELKAKKTQELQDKKPPYYKHVKSNVPIGRVEIYKGAISEIPRCHCRPDSDHPCGPDSDCINRLMMYECDSSVCPAGENCQNQRLQRHLDVDAMPFRTPSRGWGLKTKVDIEKGCFIAEYVGDLIDEVECQRRLDEAHERNISNFYMLTLDKNRIIDAGPKGNYSRFMNHSCQPNCETQKWNVNGDIRIGIFAIVDIPAGEELTFNYNLVCRGDKKTVCHCGAPVCSGFLGERPKSLPTDGEKKKKKRKKIRQPKQMIIHEDTCYRCGVGGELVLCDKTNCPKSYHLKCLKLLQIPRGKWICPWHLCDHEFCGKWATKLCVLCPNSFCSRHFQGNLFQLGESGDLVCSDHTSVLATADVVSISSSVPSTPMSTGMSCSSSETNSVSGVDGVYPYTSAATPSLLQSSKKAAAKKDTKTSLGNSLDSRADSTLPNGVVLSDSLTEKIETKKPSIEENAGTASTTPGRFSKRLRTSSTSTKDGLSSAIERTNGELK